MNTTSPRPPLDPTEPPARASESLSEGGFPDTDAEIADLLKINQCTDAEVADLLDPDRNAAEIAALLESLDF